MTPRAHPLRGVALMLAALMLFALLDATAKHLSQIFAVPLLVWARYTLHCLLMVVFLVPSMRGGLLRTRRPGSQILRALMLLATTGLGIAALRLMPLAETTALGFLSPLIVTVLAGPWLGERIGAARWAAVLAGFLGVLLIARPGSAMVDAGVAFALGAAVCYSVYQILTRQLSASESTLTMLFYTALVGSVVMTAALPWFWGGPVPTPLQALMIASLGIYGGAGHFLLIRAFRRAPASVLSPFLYVQLIWATLLGWLVFDHLPDMWSVAGMIVIAASGLAVALAERHGTKQAER
jgi:drug/metabolite transporter (DMT)-like permease